jgi:uncharacterized protein
MTDAAQAGVGTIGWIDLTIDQAPAIRDFYQQVVGWEATPVEMGDYSDFAMTPPAAATAVAGICHARGENKGLPPQWLIYIIVADLASSIQRCEQLGGKLLVGPRSAGADRYCVIQDPAGAVAGLYERGGQPDSR